MPQAITVRFLPCTIHKGTRLKAFCERGSVTIGFPHASPMGENQRIALRTLIKKFLAEDKVRYGSTEDNPWSGPWIMGETKNRETVFVNARWADQITVSL